MSVVSFIDVERFFGKTPALAGVNLELGEGVVYGLVGRNGAGKTTMLRMIPALLHPTEGTVKVFGMDPWDHQEEIKKRLGYLAETDKYPGSLKIRDLIQLCSEVYPEWDQKMADGLLNEFGLNISKKTGALSKGQQRQVGLICAVCHRPRLLVLDEPAGGLDPVVRREFLEVVIDLLYESGSTIIFSSHQFADVERLATRVGILHQGKILVEREMDDFRENSCRALIRGDGIEETKLMEIQNCIRVRKQEDDFIATFTVNQAEARDQISAKLGSQGDILEMQQVSLEDLFIDWTGNP